MQIPFSTLKKTFIYFQIFKMWHHAANTTLRLVCVNVPKLLTMTALIVLLSAYIDGRSLCSDG